MDTKEKKRKLPLLVIILIAFNILTLAVIWYLYFYADNPSEFKGHHRQNIEDFMKNKMNFTAEQTVKLNALRNEHFKYMKMFNDSILTLKHAVVDEMMKNAPDTAFIKLLVNRVGVLMADNEFAFARHFMEIKEMCDPTQRVKLKAFLEEIVSHKQMPGTHKPHGGRPGWPQNR